jgi:hypothetical protein
MLWNYDLIMDFVPVEHYEDLADYLRLDKEVLEAFEDIRDLARYLQSIDYKYMLHVFKWISDLREYVEDLVIEYFLADLYNYPEELENYIDASAWLVDRVSAGDWVVLYVVDKGVYVIIERY